MSDTTLPRPLRMTRHGIWGALGTLATGGAAVTAPNHDLVTAALISLASGLLIAVVGPITTAWARNLFHGRNEQKTLNDHLIDEMADLRHDNETLREENAGLREENTRLRRRR